MSHFVLQISTEYEEFVKFLTACYVESNETDRNVENVNKIKRKYKYSKGKMLLKLFASHYLVSSRSHLSFFYWSYIKITNSQFNR